MDTNLRHIDSIRYDYLLMAEFKNIQELLDDFKHKVIAEAKQGMPRNTGALANSLKGYVKESKRSIQISFTMDEYGFYQDRGVKGVKSGKSLSGYKFGTGSSLIGKSKGGMSGVMAKWAKQKGIQWKDKKTGRFMSHKSMGYLIARSIYTKGIKPSLFFTKPFEKYYKRLPDELSEMFGLDLEQQFSQILDENFKKLK